VTITGCSAGGQSTMLHLTSPQSWPYFSKVVSFSGPNGIPYKNLTEAAELNTMFFRNMGCCKDNNLTCKLADIACLRSKTWQGWYFRVILFSIVKYSYLKFYFFNVSIFIKSSS
jgi:carboxylesterase type B